MIRSILLFLLTLVCSTSQCQTQLWATGTALPDGPCQLVSRPDGKFRFAGALAEGELQLMTTPTYQEGVTQFLTPKLVDSYLINYGLSYTLTTDKNSAGWVVPFSEDTYRFIVDTAARTVRGELFLPWNELLIAGSAFPGGSDKDEWKRDNMLPFVRDHEDPYVFEWTGELGIYDNVVEPGRFKLEGQMTWGPRELHPFVNDEDILEAAQLRTGGDDTKWRVVTPGVYRIRVNLFTETIHAELLSAQVRLDDQLTPIHTIHNNHAAADHIYDLQGNVRQHLSRGLNIVRQADGTTRKMLVK